MSWTREITNADSEFVHRPLQEATELFLALGVFVSSFQSQASIM